MSQMSPHAEKDLCDILHGASSLFTTNFSGERPYLNSYAYPLLPSYTPVPPAQLLEHTRLTEFIFPICFCGTSCVILVIKKTGMPESQGIHVFQCSKRAEGGGRPCSFWLPIDPLLDDEHNTLMQFKRYAALPQTPVPEEEVIGEALLGTPSSISDGLISDIVPYQGDESQTPSTGSTSSGDSTSEDQSSTSPYQSMDITTGEGVTPGGQDYNQVVPFKRTERSDLRILSRLCSPVGIPEGDMHYLFEMCPVCRHWFLAALESVHFCSQHQGGGQTSFYDGLF